MTVLTLPPGVQFPKLTPAFSTTIQTAVSGAETRLRNQAYPLRQWEIPVEFLRNAAATPEMQALLGAFCAAGGAFGAFLVTDPDDCQATAQAIGQGDGATTQFQLVRTIAGVFVEPIKAPNSVTAIRAAGVTKNPATYAVDAATGIVTFAAAPANGAALEADFSYYWRVRFADDSIDLTKFMDGLWSSTIKLRQIK